MLHQSTKQVKDHLRRGTLVHLHKISTPNWFPSYGFTIPAKQDHLEIKGKLLLDVRVAKIDDDNKSVSEIA